MENPVKRQRSPPSFESKSENPKSIKLSVGLGSSFESESENPKSRKVGMFCVSADEKIGEEIKVYVLDLDSCADGDEFKKIKPEIRILDQNPFHHHAAFCVQGSTLYLFDGGKPFFEPPDLSRKTAAKLVLNEHENKIVDVCDMHQIKFRPKALPTPDGQHILVFSTVFLGPETHPPTSSSSGFHGFHIDYIWERDRASHPASPDTAFELYDTVNDTWKTLPGLPLTPLGDLVKVFKFSFISESQFYVGTSHGGFILDLISYKWASISSMPDEFVTNYFVTLCGGRSALLLEKVYKCDDDKFVFGDRHFRVGRCPLSIFPPSNTPRWIPAHWKRLAFPSILPLHHPTKLSSIQENGVCETCTLQAETCFDGPSLQRLLVDVRRTHLKDLHTEILNTLKLEIDHLLMLYSLALFPI